MDGQSDHSPGDPGRSFPIWPLVLLIGLMCLLELAIFVIAATGPGPVRARLAVLEFVAFWPGLLADWQPHYAGQPVVMFVTYGFFHGGFFHLLVNMVTLLSLGGVVLERFGLKAFWIIYAASLLGGAAGYGLLARTEAPMVGASGALFGLIGAVLARDLMGRSALGLSLWPVARAVAFLTVLNLVLWWAMGGLLAWQAHLGGFVLGWGAALMFPEREGRR